MFKYRPHFKFQAFVAPNQAHPIVRALIKSLPRVNSRSILPLAIRTDVLYNIGVLTVIVLVAFWLPRLLGLGDHENNNLTCRHIHPRRGPG